MVRHGLTSIRDRQDRFRRPEASFRSVPDLVHDELTLVRERETLVRDGKELVRNQEALVPYPTW